MQLVTFSTLALRTLATLVVFIDVASSLHSLIVNVLNARIQPLAIRNARMQAYKCDKEHKAMCKQMEVGVNLEQLQFLGKV
jgi:hypothetical protein